MHRGGSFKSSDAITRVQVERLAKSILARSPTELAEIATVNPAIYDEWIMELSRRSDEAHEEALRMARALQSLKEAPKRAGGDETA